LNNCLTILNILLLTEFYRCLGDPIKGVWKSHPKLLPYPEGRKSTIFADKLMKFCRTPSSGGANEGLLEELDI